MDLRAAQSIPELPRISQRTPEPPGACRSLPEHPRASQSVLDFPELLRASQSEPPRVSLILPEPPRASQSFLNAHQLMKSKYLLSGTFVFHQKLYVLRSKTNVLHENYTFYLVNVYLFNKM